MSKGQIIAGRTKNDDVFDLYETPQQEMQEFLEALKRDNIDLEGDILEPCSGAGAICKVLDKYTYQYRASDIQDEDFIFGDKGVDVFSIENKSCDILITNPPYNFVTKNNDMINKFLDISKDKVILLLNIFYLSSSKRKELLKKAPLKYIYIYSNRLTMFPYGEEKPKNGGTKMFAWYVWEHGYESEPIVRWI